MNCGTPQSRGPCACQWHHPLQNEYNQADDGTLGLELPVWSFEDESQAEHDNLGPPVRVTNEDEGLPLPTWNW
jgi:hypothetical protein